MPCRQSALPAAAPTWFASRLPATGFTYQPLVSALYCALLGLAAAATAAAPAPAHAQQIPGASTAQTRILRYDIPAGPLTTALNQLADRANILLSVSGELTLGKVSPGLRGAYPLKEAFGAVLAGTGLEAVRREDGSYSLRQAPVSAQGVSRLSPVTVSAARLDELLPAYAGGQVAIGGRVGMLGNLDAMDTPFSQTSYTNKTIQDQQAQTVQDVLVNNPSVITTTKNNIVMDAGSIRGMRTNAYLGATSLNGLPGMAPLQFPSTDYIERVEVLLGPSALLNGMQSRSNIGGTVNLVTKQADDEPLTQLTTRYTSKSQLGAHVDVGRRFGPGYEFGIRFNGAFSGGDTPIDRQTTNDGSAAISLDYRSRRVRLSADFVHQSQKISPFGYGISLWPVLDTIDTVPHPPSTRTSLGPEWVGSRLRSTLGMLRGEVDILDNVSVYAAFGAQRYKQSGRDVFVDLIDADGRLELTPRMVRDAYDVVSGQGGIRAIGTTGPVTHTLNLNLSQTKQTTHLADSYGDSFIVDSMYDPAFPPLPDLADPGSPRKSSRTDISSIGIADTLSMFDDRVLFTVGIRYQKVGATNFDTATGRVSSDYDAHAWTPAFGLVVKPWRNVSLYANHIEGLQPGITVGNFYANAGEVFPPYVSKQYEAGIKVDWGKVTTTLAVFQIASRYAIPVPNAAGGPPRLEVSGEQRNRGIELNAYGQVSRSVRLLGGVTLLDARQVKTADEALNGKRAHGAPAVRAVIGGEWDTPFVDGLTLTGRVSYTSDQLADSSRPDLKIPSWKQVDLGARYVFDSPWSPHPVTIRLNVDNVFNASHWKGTYGELYRSEPRTYRLSAAFQF